MEACRALAIASPFCGTTAMTGETSRIGRSLNVVLPWRDMFRERARRASVTLWTALMAPTLTGAISLGVEVSRFSAIQVEAQRIADVAALAGTMYYNQNTGQANLAQNAATYAARIAEINGISGTPNPTWHADTKILNDNNVTVQMLVGAGLVNASDDAVKVTVSKPASLTMAGLITNLSSVTITASAWAEIVSTTNSTGPQPCLMALNTNGITNDITFTGSVTIDSSTCSIRSNSGVSFSGSVSATTAGVYAATTVSKSGSVSITGGIYQNSGTLSDPYTSNTTLQSALTAAQTATGAAISVSGSNNVTLNPGTYSSINIQGSTNITMNPGLYTVKGNVSFSGSTTIRGTGVTMVTAGTFSAAGSSDLLLTAPTTSTATNGAIPGILFASTSSSVSSFTGSSQLPFTGVIYYPNGEMDFAGSSADGSSGCAQVIAGSLKFTGSVSVGSNCSQYGTAVFGSQLTTTTALQLVK